MLLGTWKERHTTGMKKFIEQQIYENIKLKEENYRFQKKKFDEDECKDDENARIKEENSERKFLWIATNKKKKIV